MLKAVSIIEATIYLVLVVSVLAHRLIDAPDRTAVLGLVHGVWFLVYLAFVVRAGVRWSWPVHDTVTLLFVAAIPLGGYYVAARLLDRLPGGHAGTSGPTAPQGG